MKERLANLGKLFTSCRTGVAVVSGIVIVGLITKPLPMICITAITITWMVCETVRKSQK